MPEIAKGLRTPHLVAFCEEWPKTRIGILRQLWPTVQACLDAGHTMRDVHQKLRLDGIEMAYSTFCWAVATLRQRRDAGRRRPQDREGTAPHTGEIQGLQGAVDPLRNVKRLTQRRPGFEYSGTLPDEALFGPK
jgi:hypothetical protein